MSVWAKNRCAHTLTLNFGMHVKWSSVEWICAVANKITYFCVSYEYDRTFTVRSIFILLFGKHKILRSVSFFIRFDFTERYKRICISTYQRKYLSFPRFRICILTSYWPFHKVKTGPFRFVCLNWLFYSFCNGRFSHF